MLVNVIEFDVIVSLIMYHVCFWLNCFDVKFFVVFIVIDNLLTSSFSNSSLPLCTSLRHLRRLERFQPVMNGHPLLESLMRLAFLLDN